jgi:hypothetical protein
MNAQFLRIFLEDPKPWSDSHDPRPKSILSPFSALNCKETWITSDDYPRYTPADGAAEKSYALSRKWDQIYKIEYEGEDGAPEITGKDVWVYSALRISVRYLKDIPALLQHPPVRGSLEFKGDDEVIGTVCADLVFNYAEQKVTFTKDGWLTYCPVFAMRLKKMECFTSSDHSKWSLELVEKNKKDA